MCQACFSGGSACRARFLVSAAGWLPRAPSEARRRIFGLNGASVYDIDVAALHGRGAAYRENPNPSFATFGPKNRREFLSLWDARGGVPG